MSPRHSLRRSFATGLLFALPACGGAPSARAPVSPEGTRIALTAPGAPAGTQPGGATVYAWQKPPSPIAGKWETSCGGMIIELTLDGPSKATGTIRSVGTQTARGYQVGEVIFNLTAAEYGSDWIGESKWRSPTGPERWDPIRIAGAPEALQASMTTDDCFKTMTPAR